MSTQLRLDTVKAGTNQAFLDDLIDAYNDFFGKSGDEWNNTGGSGRWDAGNVWTGNLAGVSGQPLDTVLDAIDDLVITGGTDTNIVSGTLGTAAGPRLADFGSNTLEFTNVAGFTLGGTSVNTLKGTVSSRLVSSNTGLGGSAQYFEGSANGTNYIEFKAPDSLALTTVYEWPVGPPSQSGYVLASTVGGALSWVPLGAGLTDTSLTTGSLAQAGSNRTADFNNFSLEFTNASTVDISSSAKTTLTNTGVTLVNQAAEGGLLSLTDTDVNTVSFQAPDNVTGDYTVKLPTGIGTAGQVMQISSVAAGVATCVWADNTVGGGTQDTSITTGTLLAATANRSVPMANFNLDFQSVGDVTWACDAFEITNANSSFGGSIELKEPSAFSVDGIKIKCPDSDIQSYTIVLPDAEGTAGEYLRIDSVNAGILTTEWRAPAADSSITVGTLGVATSSRTVDLNNNTLDFVDSPGYTFTSSTGESLSLATDLQFSVDRVQIDGSDYALPGVLRLKEPSNLGTGYIDLIAPTANIVTNYSITFPSSPPDTGQVLKCTNNGGTGNPTYLWQDLQFIEQGGTSGTTGTSLYNGVQGGNTLLIKRLHSSNASISISDQGNYVDITSVGAGGGETNTGSSLGGDVDVFKQKVSANLEFRGITNDGNVTLTERANDIGISVAQRKEGADSLGSGTSFTVDWDAGDSDQKDLSLTGASTITLNSPTREGTYQLYVKSGSNQSISWLGTTATSAGNTQPFPLTSNSGFRMVMHWDGTGWTIESLSSAVVSEGSISGTYSPQCDFVNYMFEISTVTAGTTITTPTDMAEGKTVTLSFQAGTNVPSISGFTATFGPTPTHVNRCLYHIYKQDGSFYICRAEAN